MHYIAYPHVDSLKGTLCRSLAACEQLSRAGYPSLAWINGGFDTAQKGDLPAEGDTDLRLGGIGGVSELLGWTEVQRDLQRSEGFAGGSNTIIKLVSACTFDEPSMQEAPA